MAYSKDRQGALSQKIVAALKSSPAIEWEDDPETVRRLLNRTFAECERAEESLRKDAELHVSQMKKSPPQGSADWDILVRRNLEKEYDRTERFAIKTDKG